jgi:hypothetical protein
MEYYEMIDPGTNVYHLLFYMISNFLIADTNKEIYYYYPYKNNKLEDELLELLPPNFHRQAEKIQGIHYTTFMHAIPIFEDTALPQSYVLLRHLFKNSIYPQILKKKIYIRRNPKHMGTAKRTLINTMDVDICMSLLGFEIVELEDYKVPEQIKKVTEAEVIVSPHGAALAYTVFCHPGTNIIEIYKSNTKPKRHYMHIAQECKLTFFRFNDVKVVDEDENMEVNVHSLFNFLKDFI